MTACCAPFEGWHCTRPADHDGEHIATIGPYSPTAPVLARWRVYDSAALKVAALPSPMLSEPQEWKRPTPQPSAPAAVLPEPVDVEALMAE